MDRERYYVVSELDLERLRFAAISYGAHNTVEDLETLTQAFMACIEQEVQTDWSAALVRKGRA
jgi:hypothetical protein